jgi:hypothetical protein
MNVPFLSQEKLRYRSFCYDDWLCEFLVNPSPFDPKYLDQLVDEAATGRADVLVLNPNGQTAAHPSKVWQTMWKAYQSGKREAAVKSAYGQEEECEAFLQELVRLAEKKFDYLAHTFAACRRRGIATGVSIRMNDCHGNATEPSLLVSDFHVANPQFHLPGPTGTCLNYAHAEVRDHFMKLIAEMIDDYDIDVLDLDFCRQPWCFPEDGKIEEHCDTMTAFLTEVRGRIERSRKRIALMVRVPASLPQTRALGLDVGRWANDELIDGVILGGYLHAAWRASVPECRQVVGDRVAIYASGDYFADTRERLPARELGLHADLMRGFAAGQLANGADGIYWFNFVVVRQATMKGFWDKPASRDATRPCFEAIGECNTLASLRGKSKTYIATSITQHGPSRFDLPPQLPLDLQAGEEHAFELLLAREHGSVRVHVAVLLRADARVDGVALLRFNDECLDSLAAHQPGPKDAQTLLFPVPPSVMRDGLNRIVIRNGSKPIRVIALEIRTQEQS